MAGYTPIRPPQPLAAGCVPRTEVSVNTAGSQPSRDERGFSGTVGAHPSIHPPVAHASTWTPAYRRRAFGQAAFPESGMRLQATAAGTPE